MKLLRNPYVVAALAVAAVGLVFYQMMPHMKWLRRAKPAAAKVNVPQPAIPPTAPVVAATAQKVPPPAEPVATAPEGLMQADLSAISAHPFALDLLVLQRDAERWASGPAKDPFKVRFYTTRSTNWLAASQVLTLGGIWQQEQSSLAVLNNTVLAQGEQILGYMISKIENEGVWVEGQNGREFVGFKTTAVEPDDEATAISGGSAPGTVTGTNLNAATRNQNL